MTAPTFPAVLQDFFGDYLLNQKNVSARTVESYRDTFRLLLKHVQARTAKSPVSLTFSDLESDTVLAFLRHLEECRHNSVRTRNSRLAAIRSFMKYASLRVPDSLRGFESIMAIPMKRFERRIIGFLTRGEVDAILNATDAGTWSGRRDRVMFTVFYNTGGRISEIAGLNVADLDLERSSAVRLHGKGRKERVVPLWHGTAKQLRQWLEHIQGAPDSPLFPNCDGGRMTRSGIEYRLDKAVREAAVACPSLATRNVSPHTLRHTTAMHLLQAGVEPSVIALWLGHESITTTHQYMQADLTMKERALKLVAEPPGRRFRFQPTDRLLQFLDGL